MKIPRITKTNSMQNPLTSSTADFQPKVTSQAHLLHQKHNNMWRRSKLCLAYATHFMSHTANHGCCDAQVKLRCMTWQRCFAAKSTKSETPWGSREATCNCSINTVLESLAAPAALGLPVAAGQLQSTGPDELRAGKSAHTWQQGTRRPAKADQDRGAVRCRSALHLVTCPHLCTHKIRASL